MLPLQRTERLLRRAFLACVLLGGLSLGTMVETAQGQSVETLSLPRLTAPVVLDGRVDEAAWDAVEPLPMTMYVPVFRGEMTERTEIRVAYDDDYLYVAGRMFDSDPDGIRANSLYRDRYSGDDTFAIIIDTFNDNENALWFYTSPLGVRFDMSVSNDAESGGGSSQGGAMNSSWNTYWDVATTQTEAGWFAEMRIPFSSLGFQTQDDVVTMGMSSYRYIARKGERHTFPAISPDWGTGFAKPSQMQTVELRDVTAQKPLYISPYVSAGAGRTSDLVDGAYQADNDFTRAVGLDVKYNVTSNLTLDATLNTDFAQVEADNQQVNLTRFSLFFPEKRQFFQERSSLFNFELGRRDRLFHSRNIGLSGGETIRIYGGARLVGRIGDWDVGLIDMQTEAGAGLPSENFGVVRARRRVLNDQSYAGSMFTSRLGDDGSYNTAYGLDGLFYLGDEQFLDIKWTQSITDTEAFDFFQSGLALMEVRRRGNIGFVYQAAVTYAGDRYNPGIGFITRNNYTYVRLDGQYGWRPEESSILRNYDGSVYGNVYFRNSDGSVESVRAGHSWDVDFKSSASARFSVNIMQEDLLSPLSFPENTTVPAGRHTYTEAQARYDMPDGSLVRGQVEIEGGTFFDGTRLSASASPTWNVNRFLELAASYSFTHLSFPDRDESANVHLVGVRTQVGINTRLSWNAFVQYNTEADLVAANVRFRYNVREGNDLWLVYNENLNGDRTRFEPELPRSQSRTLLFKYTYTFAL